MGGDTPRRGPCPRPEPDPTPLSPLLPWALTFGLGCVPLCTVQVYQESCQVCSAGTPYRVYLMGSSPLATPPSARLWGGWFGQNPTRWCFLLVIATHCPHLFLACKFPSPGCAECPISSPIARPPDVGASGIISSLIGVLGDHTCRAHSRCSINAGIPLNTPAPRPAAGLPSASCRSPVDGFWGPV